MISTVESPARSAAQAASNTVPSAAQAVAGEANSSFSTILPGLQIAWDSTSYNALCSCPRLYQYSIIEGWTAYGQNDHLTFGILFHAGTETYSHSRATGKDHDVALVDALRQAFIQSWDWTLNRPWTSVEPTKTRKTLFRSLVWYLDKFKDDSLETLILANGKPAVELSFRFNLADVNEEFVASTGEAFMLCGHIDRVVEWNEELWITDKKTTKYALDENYFRQYTPDNQISLYALAGMVVLNSEIEGLIIDAGQILVEGSRFRRQPIHRSPEQLEEWLTDLRFRLSEAETYARHGHWPMNPKSCGYGHRQCQFRPVCSAEPSIRQTLLESQYTKRVWDPLQPR